MKRVQAVLLLPLLAFACGAPGERGHETAADRREASRAAGVTADCPPVAATHPIGSSPEGVPEGIPVFSLRAFHDAAGVLDSLWVLRAGERVQTLLRQEADAEPAPPGRADVGREDIDFDGVPDIWHLNLWGATGNTTYTWWLYDPQQGGFRYSPEFSEKIGGYTLDPVQKRITVRTNGGLAGSIFEERVFEVRDSRLVEVSSIVQDWLSNEERYVRTTRRRQGDQVVEQVDTLRLEELPEPQL